MKSLEDAYERISKGILWFVKDSKWSYGQMEASIWAGSTQASYVRRVGDSIVRDDKFPELGLAIKSSEALLFLRDNVYKSTGGRIWGLTFTLYPDGKFDIEFDYKKPDRYEETTETISGVEINESLNKIGNQAD